MLDQDDKVRTFLDHPMDGGIGSLHLYIFYRLLETFLRLPPLELLLYLCLRDRPTDGRRLILIQSTGEISIVIPL